MIEDAKADEQSLSGMPNLLHVFSEDPLILIGVSPHIHIYLEALGEISKKKRIHFICVISWTLYEMGDLVLAEYQRMKNEFPNILITYMCNSPEEFSLGREKGIPSFYCSQNAFLNENSYEILPNERRVFSAIYLAAFADYKRHYLAKEVKSLALVGYPQKASYRSIFNTLPHAQFINFDAEQRYRWIEHSELVTSLNRSRVGLCLSRVEGAMFASAEYLLCGLPIVSTTSLGGREVLFDERYSMVVEDNPTQIAKAVQTLIDKKISPYEVRERTLELMAWHRRQFDEFIKKIFISEGVPLEKRKDSYRALPNKVFTNYSKEELLNFLDVLKDRL